MSRLEEPSLVRTPPPDAPSSASGRTARPALPQDPAVAARARTIARLKTYLLGVAIGVVLAAMLFLMRWQARAMDRAAGDIQNQGHSGTTQR